jgi:prohibitin 2
MSGQDAFKRFVQQLQQSGKDGRGFSAPRPPKGSLGATGALLFLVGGGLLLNASLFNGACASPPSIIQSLKTSSVDGGHRAIKYKRSV